MLTCLPQSLCSWDYRIVGTKAGPAALTFNFWTEQGTMTLGPESYAIVKGGPLSGHWMLQASDGAVVANAIKPSAFVREFEVDTGERMFTVRAQAPLGRSFDLLSNGSMLGTIAPAHAFTRRATIDGGVGLAEREKLFGFWLAVMTWRRAAKNN
jgi:hypothetical protein